MDTGKKALITFALLIVTGFVVSVTFPREVRYNKHAQIRIGAGDDITGILMNETASGLTGKYQIKEGLESNSFMDC